MISHKTKRHRWINQGAHEKRLKLFEHVAATLHGRNLGHVALLRSTTGANEHRLLVGNLESNLSECFLDGTVEVCRRRDPGQKFINSNNCTLEMRFDAHLLRPAVFPCSRKSNNDLRSIHQHFAESCQIFFNGISHRLSNYDAVPHDLQVHTCSS